MPAGERRLGWALTDAGEPVVVTDAALLLPAARLEWRQVERASWAPPVLVVDEVAEIAGTGARHALALVDEADLPAVVRTRVTASVAWSSHSRLSPAGGVRVVGRRRTGPDGLEWQLVYDEGTDTGDPLVRAQAEQLLAAARSALG